MFLDNRKQLQCGMASGLSRTLLPGLKCLRNDIQHQQTLIGTVELLSNAGDISK